MVFYEPIAIGLDQLRANKLRSLLTFLGIVICVAAVIGVFGLLTIAVMMATVAAAYRGVGFITNYGFGPHGDVAAGLVVAASGAAVLWFGL